MPIIITLCSLHSLPPHALKPPLGSFTQQLLRCESSLASGDPLQSYTGSQSTEAGYCFPACGQSPFALPFRVAPWRSGTSQQFSCRQPGFLRSHMHLALCRKNMAPC